MAPFPLQIDVPPPLPRPYPPHVPPPLPPTIPPEPLPLIALPPYPSYSVAYKEYDIVVEFHQKKWEEYTEGTKLKPVTLRQWRLKTIFIESIFPGSPIDKKITQLDFFLQLLPRDRLDVIVTFTNEELRRKIYPATTIWEIIYIYIGF